ncbi:MAG: acetylxylan esterase [Asticcacaulis sp.]
MKVVVGLVMALNLLALPASAKDWTAEQDHQNMMDQLNIKTLRPGPNGDEKAPDHANYDESKANPYPDWPEILTLNNGQKVTTPQQWWQKRRPEIVEAFEREVVGRVPAHVPNATWRVDETDAETLGDIPIVASRLIGHVDNTATPDIKVDIQAMLILPQNVKGPVPVLVMYSWGAAQFPAPKIPPAPPKDMDPRMAAFFASAQKSNTERLTQLVADGWGVVVLDPTSYQADNGAGLTKGIIGLVNKGEPRKPDDWGALRAWAWGAGQVYDYLATRPEVDKAHIGIEGVSRYGKAALVTMAFDQRFYMGLIGSSGEGGAKPHRRNFGEAVESLTGTGEYHWMAGNFLKYGGPMNAGDIPVDSHQLIALAAPRLIFISYGIPKEGDAKWLDQQGSYMATVAAGSVWKLLGAKDLGVGNDYKTAVMPPPLTDMLDGQLAWRQHVGGHTDGPNVASFLQWADKNMGRK